MISNVSRFLSKEYIRTCHPNAVIMKWRDDEPLPGYRFDTLGDFKHGILYIRVGIGGRRFILSTNHHSNDPSGSTTWSRKFIVIKPSLAERYGGT